jgi:ActR/RegA family two-component response regulator
MTELKNILIVEDEDNWINNYSRYIEPFGYPLKVAKNLKEAINILKEMTFVAAFVDICLNKNDKSNTDGLKVLEEIKSIGDLTSSIVITGYGTMKIARDALKKYNALDTIDKSTINPNIINNLINQAIEEFKNNSLKQPFSVLPHLRGERSASDWDYDILTLTKPKGGIETLHEFLTHLVSPFCPIIAEYCRLAMSSSLNSKIVWGYYWSRALGKPIAIVFGEKEKINPWIENDNISSLMSSEYNVAELLKDYSRANLRGTVWSLKDKTREEFGK